MQRIKTATIGMACSAVLVAAFAARTLAADPATTSKMPEPVELASPDDCAIIVEVGKDRLDWGDKAPDAAFYPEFERDGGGTYLEKCSWKELGVAEPLTAAQQPKKGFFISRPTYAGKQATVTFRYFMSGSAVDGRKPPPFVKSDICTLRKPGDHWYLMECKTQFIT